jgi:putative ABC transport system permease protein
MWRMVLRDLQWRRRRFVIAGVATALVFAMTLLLTGMTAAVNNEMKRTVNRFTADAWIVPAGANGVFTQPPRIPVSAGPGIAGLAGVERAEPMLALRGTVSDDGVQDVNIIAQEADGLGWPEVDEGTSRMDPGEAVVDEVLGYEVGDTVTVAGRALQVAGVASKVSYTFGIGTVFVLMEDGQALALGGAPLATAYVLHGIPEEIPDGFDVLTNDDVLDDINRPMSRGTESISLIQALLTITAAGIVGLIVYLSSIERTSDLAVMKATGASRRFMASGLVLQALLLSVVAALVGGALSQFLVPMFPITLEVTGGAYIQLAILAVSVGILASLAGVWRALRVDPASAFGGS